jgi:hypothetical protein
VLQNGFVSHRAIRGEFMFRRPAREMRGAKLAVILQPARHFAAPLAAAVGGRLAIHERTLQGRSAPISTAQPSYWK